MMAHQHTLFTHYAILIGIDAYRDKPLKCCVRDIQRINEYLEGISVPVQTHMFTASESIDSKSSSQPEDPKSWPTYTNITSAFQNITSQARAGDFVYIHFSGHGTRQEPEPDDEFSNMATGDLAWVLLDGGDGNHVRYFWGLELALSLKSMVDKGLVVTLILDCCFSATVYRRDDPSVRFLPYDAEIGSKSSLYDQVPGKCLEHGAGSLATRDASMRPNWLINPDGYAILTACGPHEVASEFKSDDGQIHGALSYFLLRTLRAGLLGKRHRDIYNHLCAQFRKLWPQQKPVLYGNKEQGFFGSTNLGISTANVPIIECQDGRLEIQAGQAHGICDGDRFAVNLMSATETTSESKRAVKAKVVQVRALTSDLEPLLDKTLPHFQFEDVAKAITRLCLRKFPIQLATALPNQGEWAVALQERSLNIHSNDHENRYSSHITVNNRSNEYELLDASGQKIVNLPTMKQSQTDINFVCDIVEHLARFEMVRDLANELQGDRFRESFSAILTCNGDTYDPGGLLEVEQDDEAKFMFELQVKNKGNRDLCVYVYNLGPFWQIENVLRASYEVIPPRNIAQNFTGMFRKKLKTVVPLELRGKGHHPQLEDIIKVFVTSQPTSFDLLELPKLGHPGKKFATSRTSHGSHPSEEWAAMNFLVRTHSR